VRSKNARSGTSSRRANNPQEEAVGSMSNEERVRRVRSRIVRAHTALERAAVLVRTDSHVETVETALVQAISETAKAEKLVRPVLMER
jgi:hypothetical protein